MKKLSHRKYFTVHEVVARRGCTIADIAGWSSKGTFDIVTGIPFATCGLEIVAGEVVVSVCDILLMFRRCGTGPQTARIRRVRINGCDYWALVTDPPDGVEVSISDLMITGQRVHKFEDDYNLMRRISGGTGSTPLCDREGMINALIAVYMKRACLPHNPNWLPTCRNVRRTIGWRSNQDERSIRRRVGTIWKRLRKLQNREGVRTPARRKVL